MSVYQARNAPRRPRLSLLRGAPTHPISFTLLPRRLTQSDVTEATSPTVEKKRGIKNALMVSHVPKLAARVSATAPDDGDGGNASCPG